MPCCQVMVIVWVSRLGWWSFISVLIQIMEFVLTFLTFLIKVFHVALLSMLDLLRRLSVLNICAIFFLVVMSFIIVWCFYLSFLLYMITLPDFNVSSRTSTFLTFSGWLVSPLYSLSLLHRMAYTQFMVMISSEGLNCFWISFCCCMDHRFFESFQL